MLAFKTFREGWVNICGEFNKYKVNKEKETTRLGAEFERYFNEKILSSVTIKGYKFLTQQRVIGVNYRWDFLIVKDQTIRKFDVDASNFNLLLYSSLTFPLVPSIMSVL